MARLLATSICLGALWLVSGCAQTSQSAPQLTYSWKIAPNPPQMGAARCTLSLLDKTQPVVGADVRLEGNMSHPGMTPSLAQMKETSPGNYVASLNFTMGGDWFVLVDAKLRDGRLWHQQINVPDVKSR